MWHLKLFFPICPSKWHEFEHPASSTSPLSPQMSLAYRNKLTSCFSAITRHKDVSFGSQCKKKCQRYLQINTIEPSDTFLENMSRISVVIKWTGSLLLRIAVEVTQNFRGVSTNLFDISTSSGGSVGVFEGVAVVFRWFYGVSSRRGWFCVGVFSFFFRNDVL